MAAVSHWPAATQHGSPFSESRRDLSQGHHKRNIDVTAGNGDDNDNSDAYSFEARSDGSGEEDDHAAGATVVASSSSEAVRPDSLALTSPLEQLTRSLSFNKKDSPTSVSVQGKSSNAWSRQAQASNGGLPPVEQVMLEYLGAEPSPMANASSYVQSASATLEATENGRQPPSSTKPTNLEAVRSSEDSHQAGGAEDPDAQAQLINAFRSSYHTYMTRPGGLRDSSYSWMSPDADNPETTMDFKLAGTSDAKDMHDSQDLERFQDAISDKHGKNEKVHLYSHSDEDEAGKARRSSWDDQAARKLGLHRIPSQKRLEAPTDGRASALSVDEPFHYSSYESALRASEEAKHREQMRASNWTSLTDNSLLQEGSLGVRPLSTVHEGDQSPSLYAYAVDSPSMLQDSFAGPSRISAAIPLPRSTRGQARRTNFSRPHDPAMPQLAEQQVNTREEIERLSYHNEAGHHATHDHSHLPYASSNYGSPEPPQRPYDSIYSAYTQTRETDELRIVPQTYFGGSTVSRPHYSPSSSSQTAHTLQDMASHAHPDLQSLNLYAGPSRGLPSTESSVEPGEAKRHKRTPSQILASAIAKHRSQRAAAGLTTEGQYYVDPKSKKYYFVARSGQPGGSALIKSKDKDGKENDKPKERRKLYKKEAGWEVTKAGLSGALGTVFPPHTPQQNQRDRSLSLSGRSAGSSRASDEGQTSARKWKIWSSNRSQSSKEHLPQASPSQDTSSYGRENAGRQPESDPADSSFELIAEVRALTSSAKTSSSPGARFHNIFSEDPSPRTVDPPVHPGVARSTTAPSQGRKTEPGFPSRNEVKSGPQSSDEGYKPSHLQAPPSPLGLPSLSAVGPSIERSNSLYSNYSYYGLPADQGYVSSARTSPLLDRSQADIQAERPPNAPLHSPYIAPTGPQFQPTSGGHARQPSTTLDKAKHSISRSGSLQLLAPTKHQNLTVPKGDPALNLAELARRNPNDPLVCLHLGIDAHEKGELEESVRLFEKSAKGGCGLGMLMFGLSLRHGWGCISDPEAGFRYLQKAAESVVENLDRVISGQIQLSDRQIEEQSAKSELVLSIYELGQCFLRGWGVAKDKKTALQYFTLAANLGDPDAQSELGFCYSTGRGCKKDLKKAAKYYRMAAKQGQISYGMQWIFKTKYDD